MRRQQVIRKQLPCCNITCLADQNDLKSRMIRRLPHKQKLHEVVALSGLKWTDSAIHSLCHLLDYELSACQIPVASCDFHKPRWSPRLR